MPAKPRVEVAQGLDGAHSKWAIEGIPVFVRNGSWPKVESCAREDTLAEVSLESRRRGHALQTKLWVAHQLRFRIRGVA